MALRALMLRQKIDKVKADLSALREKEAEFVQREAELEEAIAEAQTEEEQTAVEGEVDAFTAERAANSESIADLEKEMAELEADLEAEEARQNITPATPENKRNEVKEMPNTRGRFGLTAEMVAETRSKEFLDTIRTSIREKRALENVGLTIPEVYLGIIRENVINYSKLTRHVFTRRIRGEGRELVMGSIPEAIWTACCANINTIDLSFAEVTVDCNKVAAIIPVCNAIIEDSDLNLAAEIIEAILISMGKALDKAILFGTGAGMPLGVYTRLAQTAKPADYPAAGRPWVDLSTTNLIKIGADVTGISLFQTILMDSIVMSGKYSRGETVWCMNETTYKYLKAQGMSVNAAGQIVSAVDGSMPAVGGIVEVLDFIPNYNVIAGHFDLYLLAERGPMVIETANLVKVYEDETLYRGKGRYDGVPVIAESFIGLALNGADFSAPEFAEDTANTPAFVQVGSSSVELEAGATSKMKIRVLGATGLEIKDAATVITSSDEAVATVSGTTITAVAAGSAVISISAGDATAVVNVTVS